MSAYSEEDAELREKAYMLVARAEGDSEFAARAKKDPAAVLAEVGLSEDTLMSDRPGKQLARWNACHDLTCWSSHCPGTCYITFHTHPR